MHLYLPTVVSIAQRIIGQVDEHLNETRFILNHWLRCLDCQANAMLACESICVGPRRFHEPIKAKWLRLKVCLSPISRDSSFLYTTRKRP